MYFFPARKHYGSLLEELDPPLQKQKKNYWQLSSMLLTVKISQHVLMASSQSIQGTLCTNICLSTVCIDKEN